MSTNLGAHHAEYIEVQEKLGPLDIIVIDSMWCSYTPDAKKLSRSQQIGLFKIGDLMAAINKPEYWNYMSSGETEDFKKRGW